MVRGRGERLVGGRWRGGDRGMGGGASHVGISSHSGHVCAIHCSDINLDTPQAHITG